VKSDLVGIFVAGIPLVIIVLAIFAPPELWQFLNRFMPRCLCDWFESCHVRPRQIKPDGPFHMPAGQCPRCGKCVFRTNSGKWFEMQN